MKHKSSHQQSISVKYALLRNPNSKSKSKATPDQNTKFQCVISNAKPHKHLLQLNTRNCPWKPKPVRASQKREPRNQKYPKQSRRTSNLSRNRNHLTIWHIFKVKTELFLILTVKGENYLLKQIIRQKLIVRKDFWIEEYQR